MKNNKNNKELFIFSPAFIFIIQALVTVASVYIIYRLNLLPTKYLLPILAIILILLGSFAALLFKSKGKVNASARVTSLILSLLMLVGTFYAWQGNSFIDQITGGDKDTHVISVVVLKDSSLASISDVKDLTLGANTKMDESNINQAKTLLKSNYKFEPKIADYNDYQLLGSDLMSGKQKAILLSEAHRTLMEELFDDFSSKTKVIGYVSFDEAANIEKPDVNVAKDTYSIYVTGIDTYGPVTTVSRSDVNMIVTVSPSTGQVLLTSIPRDYHVVLGTKGAYDKLTHAGIYGVGESVKTLEKLLNIKIDYNVRVNFSSVEKIVDSMGGVDVNSKYAFTSLHGKYPFVKGMNHVNGLQALGFVRERYSLPNGDNDRVYNQQELIKAILNKAMSPSIITNYSSILGSVGNSMQISMSQHDFSNIIKDQLDSNRKWEILQYQLSGTGSSSKTTYSMPGPSLYVMQPDMKTVNKASSLIEQMESGKKISLK